MKCPNCELTTDNKLSLCSDCGRFSCDNCQVVTVVDMYDNKHYKCPKCNALFTDKSDLTFDEWF
jgi:hypothetical protein